MNILGLDVGGANTKTAVLKDGELNEEIFYFPLWKRKNRFKSFIKQVIDDASPDTVALTMTAELSDAFHSKREGVEFILDSVERSFGGGIHVMSTDTEYISVKEARKNYLKVASANWAATARYVAQKYGTGILVDMGSTTTDIIPVKDGRVVARGKTDVERLQSSELIYTGILRTNIAAIIHTIPVKRRGTCVASELYATTADVYKILDEITEEEYICDTADNRGRDDTCCMARLSRVVCADREELRAEEIKEIASYIRRKQMTDVAEAIKKISVETGIERIYACGIGSFLAEEAAEKTGLTDIQGIDISPASALIGLLPKP